MTRGDRQPSSQSDVSVFVCVFTVTSHSYLIAKGTSGPEITDSAGRMMDTNLAG